MNPSRSAGSRADSFRNAISGLGAVLKSQPNAWIHAGVTVAVIGLAAWLRLAVLEWALVTTAIGLVWVAELMNTSIETLVDLASPEMHPLAAQAKDVSAAAVLAAALTAAAIGALVFLPHLWVFLA